MFVPLAHPQLPLCAFDPTMQLCLVRGACQSTCHDLLAVSDACSLGPPSTAAASPATQRGAAVIIHALDLSPAAAASRSLACRSRGWRSQGGGRSHVQGRTGAQQATARRAAVLLTISARAAGAPAPEHFKHASTTFLASDSAVKGCVDTAHMPVAAPERALPDAHVRKVCPQHCTSECGCP